MQNPIKLVYEVINDHFYFKEYEDINYDLSIGCCYSDEEKEDILSEKLENFNFIDCSYLDEIQYYIQYELFHDLDLSLEEIRFFLIQFGFDIENYEFDKEGEFKKPIFYENNNYYFLEDLFKDFLNINWEKIFNFYKFNKHKEQQEIDLNNRSEEETQAYNYWLKEEAV